MQDPKQMTWDDIREMIAKTTKLQEETDRQMQETDRRMQETAIRMQETDRLFKESNERLSKLGKYLGGVSNSNGEMAEEYFYSAFKTDKTFANEKFDKVRRNLAYNNGEQEAEFDLVLFNGKSAALIEVKYNAKPDNISVEKMISRVEIFKTLSPKCKNFNIYLGVAAMSFKKGLEAELHQAGIATIKQVGKKMVVCDKDVKVF